MKLFHEQSPAVWRRERNKGQAATDPTGAQVTMPDTLVSAYCRGTVAGCIHVPRLAFHVTLGEAF